MYRITLACSGVPEAAGPQAAVDITTEFTNFRSWYANVICSWDGSLLILQADSDVDSDGIALIDEFSDCTAAYIEELFDGEITLTSIDRLED